jgi:hypothetical protein
MPVTPDKEMKALAEEELERSVWPLVTYRRADRLVRHGPAAPTIATEAADWDADLVVVGSQGRGWVDRVLIGSVTEKLLNHLPPSLLVVPVSSAVATLPPPRSKSKSRGRASNKRNAKEEPNESLRAHAY